MSEPVSVWPLPSRRSAGCRSRSARHPAATSASPASVAAISSPPTRGPEAAPSRRTDPGSVASRAAPPGAADALLERYRQHGDRFLDGTDPDIVAAVVDAKEGEILLAAGTGTHRWFVATTAEGFVASTHPATAEAARAEPPALDRGDEDFLLSYAFVPDGRTVLEGVRVLGPGTTLRWPSGAVTEPPPASRPQSLAALDEDRAADQLFELLLEVVESQAAGEHAHAVMLGGFDSALVAALLARLGHEVHTFTFQFEDESYNQANVATVVDHIGAHHTSVPIGPDLVAESLRGFARVYAQPVAQPHYLLHTLAASALVHDRGLRHVFSGDGCDAVFLGYPTVSQRAALVARVGRLPNGLLTTARRALSTRAVEGVAGRLTATKARGVLEHAGARASRTRPPAGADPRRDGPPAATPVAAAARARGDDPRPARVPPGRRTADAERVRRARAAPARAGSRSTARSRRPASRRARRSSIPGSARSGSGSRPRRSVRRASGPARPASACSCGCRSGRGSSPRQSCTNASNHPRARPSTTGTEDRSGPS